MLDPHDPHDDPTPPVNENFDELCCEFKAEFSIWEAGRETGIAPTFLRLQLRRLTSMVETLQSFSEPSDRKTIATLANQFREIKTAAAKLTEAASDSLQIQHYHDTVNEIPELMLLELDQILEESITPEMLADFELDEDIDD